MPTRAIIELANTCNLDCPMCRVGQHGVNFNRVMPLATFRRIADEFFSDFTEVRLNGLGESTLIPDFDRYLDILASYPINVELITNGTGPERLYRRMVDSGATLLFSWDAATPELFATLRRPAALHDVRAIVQSVASHAAAAGRSQLLHLLFTLLPANIHELAAVVALAADMGIPTLVVNVAKLPDDQWMERRADDCLQAFTDADDAATRCGVRLFLPDTFAQRAVSLPSASPTAATRCDRPWREIVIRWDLDVQVCNMFNPYTYGNLSRAPLRSIWEGAFADAFRQNFKGPACHPYCRGCAYIGDVYARKQG